MASTLLEETRQYHEDIERLERLIVKEFRNEAKTHKDKLLQSHRVRQMLESLQERAAKLAATYDDADGARKEEIAALRGDNVFHNFYDRLKEVRNYHRRFPADDLTGAEDDGALLGTQPHVTFSGEEGFGRFLDLHEHHYTWVNSKFGGQVDYQSYVAALPTHLDGVPRAQRLTKQYRQYLHALLSYLRSFYERTQPLAQLERQLERLGGDFEARWEAGEVPGWEDKGEGSALPAAPANGEAVAALPEGALDLDAFDSADELEVLGAERLKAALLALGLKCGGTLRQRAERLMSVKGLRPDQYDASLFAKGAQPPARDPQARQKAAAAAQSVALEESRLRKLFELLSSVIADTVGRVEKRQAQTYEELAAEQAEAEEGDTAMDEDDEDEDEYIYNPLKLPLGWDGKPIPYWLYKLHGLNQEFKCEICGGASYWGRRAFERHFKEAQHQAGMRALGIPNTRQFFEVTTIADALALWGSLQERDAGGFKAEADEEWEDGEGNVYNRKMFLDLKRQGLI